MIDFYNIVNNDFITKNPIPKYATSYGTFHKLQLENYKILYEIVNELIKNSKLLESSKYDFYQIQFLNYYNSLINFVPSNKDIDKLDNLFLSVSDIVKQQNKTKFQIFVQYCYYLNDYCIDTPLNISYNIDYKCNNRYLLTLKDGGVSFSLKEYYNDKKILSVLKDIMAKYNLKEVDQILELEKNISYSMLSPSEKHNPNKIYNVLDRNDIYKMHPNVDWDIIIFYFFGNDTQDIWFESVDYIVKLYEIICNCEPQILGEYFRWRIYFHFLKFINPKEYFFLFKKKILGVESNKPVYLQNLEYCTYYYGNLLGHLYIKKNYGLYKKRTVLLKNIINNIKCAFHQKLKKLSWMKDSTKKRAIKKLKNMKWKIGGLDLDNVRPEQINLFLPNVTCSENDFIQNIIDLSIYKSKIIYIKHKMVLSDKDKMNVWYMNSFEVNAYYVSELNEMVFPLGILQEPIFGEQYSVQHNYGSLGIIIAHELVHAFDNNGSLFNENGELCDWWSDKDKKIFDKIKEKFIYFFSNIKVGDEFINGRLTCGENIADHAGLQVALSALKNDSKRTRKENCNMKEFFISYAQTICSYNVEKFQSYTLIKDEHCPSQIRVNANVIFCREFFRAFGILQYKNILFSQDIHNINELMNIY
jgi:putative endopeptidase